jgi:probable rRNA maturation factor
MKKRAKNWLKKIMTEMTEVVIDIDLEDNRWEENLPSVAKTIEEVKNAVFSYVGAHEKKALLQSAKPLLLHVCLSSDGEVRQLNRDFRHLDKPTNVLSFANLDFADFGSENDPFPEMDLGNIIIAYETTKKEAETEDITLYAHFCHLLVHGMLHILGFDHLEEAEAEHMESFEKNILADLGIANPYENFE